MYGGVGAVEVRGFPLSRLFAGSRSGSLRRESLEGDGGQVREAQVSGREAGRLAAGLGLVHERGRRSLPAGILESLLQLGPLRPESRSLLAVSDGLELGRFSCCTPVATAGAGVRLRGATAPKP